MKTQRTITLLFALVLTLLCVESAPAQSAVERQRRIIADLERSIANEEKQLSKLKQDKSSAQKRISGLVKQIEKRSNLISATSRQIKNLTAEVEVSERRIAELSGHLDALEASCRKMICSAYRNYRFYNALAYLFSADSFADMARRLAALRTATEHRNAQMKEIVAVREDVQQERDALSRKRDELSATRKRLDSQRANLRADAASARATLKNMSAKEKEVMRNKQAQEERLDVAIKELRKLTKGNRSGASFSRNTSGLSLPVVGGRVRKYSGNMAEITGSEGAAVRSVYEGKVVKIARNKMTGKYEIFVAHGEYITAYGNLASAAVAEGATVARNQRIGTVGSAVNLSTMEVEYKMTFAVHDPSPNVKLTAANFFK